ncbi:MAG: GTP-binding protein, partial [Chitinophagaceae bacterium]
MAGLSEEIRRRRTLAIISHPDAGKTTLTEKLLLFGGAIQVAGAVKSNKIKKQATSDFMEIEKQRGISVATSVMTFTYNHVLINLLDTPGHKDFAEDTYRTLTAVDSVILVIDSIKGVEEQTENLMRVCRMRKTPVIIFINKMDRDGGYDPFDLIDELEKKLSIQVQPLSLPINSGRDFKGIYNVYEKSILLFTPHQKADNTHKIHWKALTKERKITLLGEKDYSQIAQDIEFIEGVYPPFQKPEYLKGQLSPVFFGSALNNFGIKELLDTFIHIAPLPQERETTIRVV